MVGHTHHPKVPTQRPTNSTHPGTRYLLQQFVLFQELTSLAVQGSQRGAPGNHSQRVHQLTMKLSLQLEFLPQKKKHHFPAWKIVCVLPLASLSICKLLAKMAKIQLLSLAQTSISFFGGFSHGGFAEAFLGGLFGCLFQQLIYQALHHVLQFRKLEISMEIFWLSSPKIYPNENYQNLNHQLLLGTWFDSEIPLPDLFHIHLPTILIPDSSISIFHPSQLLHSLQRIHCHRWFPLHLQR